MANIISGQMIQFGLYYPSQQVNSDLSKTNKTIANGNPTYWDLVKAIAKKRSQYV